ncbi:hypothetical protein DN752_23780 [Echinicola strongylocentroti]|uniref:Uncharacterized protein n=1 Tax=Echinicola strongylocentroti TaxID=1795355 RepID=A0A2Z4IQ30_9BACT|nr:hypothetical protein DN752_23780 [Echinicola strongylocentroti]
MPKTKVKRLILKQFKVATDRLMHIPGLMEVEKVLFLLWMFFPFSQKGEWSDFTKIPSLQREEGFVCSPHPLQLMV